HPHPPTSPYTTLFRSGNRRTPKSRGSARPAQVDAAQRQAHEPAQAEQRQAPRLAERDQHRQPEKGHTPHVEPAPDGRPQRQKAQDRKSTRLNSSHLVI